MKRILLPLAALLLAGCSNTQEYKLYAETQRGIAQAEAIAEAARWNALQEIAKSGDTTAKVAAAMALQAGGQRGNSGPRQNIAPPKSSSEIALQWTSLLLPNLAQFYSINRNSAVAIQQSNNATALGIRQSDNQATVTANTNATFANMNSAGLNAASNIATTGITSITSVANTGSNNLTSIGIKLIDAMPLIQPNVTTTTTSTSTSTTTNNCGSGTSGGTLTCP
jgi:hypothetical protein